jgi:hypothetical protein
MHSGRCASCGKAFVPRPQVRQQRFCSAAACQRERRRPERKAAGFFRAFLGLLPDGGVPNGVQVVVASHSQPENQIATWHLRGLTVDIAVLNKHSEVVGHLLRLPVGKPKYK